MSVDSKLAIYRNQFCQKSPTLYHGQVEGNFISVLLANLIFLV